MSDALGGANSLSRAGHMFAKGDFLNAIDVLRGAPAPPEEKLQRDYLIVLALARAGATRQALRTFDATLRDVDGAATNLARDIASLRARCLKDVAYEKRDGRREALLAAAHAYESAYARFGGYYPLINTATLHLLAGETSLARKRADRVLGELASFDKQTGGDAYWRLATKAEAYLVLGDAGEAAGAIAAAAACGEASASDMASTRKQLLAVCRFQHIDATVLEAFRIPRPLRYCGHRNLWTAESPSRRQDLEHRLAEAVGGFLDKQNVGYAYGALASGADTIIAEAVLARGLELNLVFPFKLEDFVRISVAPAGEEWLNRFDACYKRAQTASFVLDNDYLPGDSLFVECAAYSMGMAELRGRNVASEPLQLAVWNGEPAFAAAGTASEIAQWLALGHESHVLSPEGAPANQMSLADVPIRLNEDRIRVRSYLFADVSGFSRLREVQLVPFVEKYLGELGDIVNRFETDQRETAGDGIYLVMRDPAEAAECALEMQRRTGEFDFEGTGLPSTLNLRIAIHHGPGQVVTDPVLGSEKLIGREITRAARMEPITPLGEVYVTEQMACALALSRGADDFACEYVGVVPSAKSFGSFRMYSLKASGI